MAQKRKRTTPAAKRKSPAKSTRSGSTKRKRQKVRIAPYLVAAFFFLLCLCITLAEYVNPFSIFPTWEEIFSVLEPYESEGGPPLAEGNVKVHFLDVGQAESILIQAPQANVLIDAGENGCGETVVGYLKSQGVSTLNLVIGTHAHSDHIGGMDEVIRQMDVKKVILSEIGESAIPTTKTYTNLLTAMLEKGLTITTAKVGDTYSLGEGVKLQIVGPNGVFTDLNNTSVVCRLTVGEVAFLFTGDCEIPAENAILTHRGITVSADVLKVGHHGSDTATGDVFLEAVNPSIAVISCGKENKYGHPHESVLKRLTGRGIAIYRTDISGTIVVTTDGTELSVSTEK